MASVQELLLLGWHLLSQLPGLGDVVSLQLLIVEGCNQLTQSPDRPDVHRLTKLRRLNVRWNGLHKLLGLNDSMQLEELVVCGSAIDELPNLHLLRHLQQLEMECIESTVMPWFGSFIALEALVLHNLPEVTDIPGMRLLTRLKRLTIYSTPNLLQLPELGDWMALQYLWLHDWCSVVGNLELPDLHNLIHLEVLWISATPIRRLPSLERLPQLRELRCSDTLLAELPVLNGLDKLESINLGKCLELTSLEKLGTLPALTSLNVSLCPSLTRLPDLRGCRSLEDIEFSRSLGREDMRALATLPALDMWGWDDVCVPFSELLETMSLDEVVLHLEAEQMKYFTTFQTRT